MARLAFLLLLTLFPYYSFSEGLECKYLYKIKERFLNTHVLYSELTPLLQKRTVEQMIKMVDGNKIFLLRSDVKKIKTKTRKIFNDIKNGNCSNLYYVYNLYIKRVEKQFAFAQKYLGKDFKLVKNVKFQPDSDLRKRPRSESDLIKTLRAYIQYQAANIYLVEKDLEKSKKYILQNLKNLKNRARSWKPYLTGREKRLCLQKLKQKNFKTCKPTKWLSFYLESFAQSLDSHSDYLDNDALEEFKINMELSLEGIGATLGNRFGYTTVERLVPGGAAYRSKKLKPKDRIISVGQRRSKMVDIFGVDLQDVVSLIRGKKGTSVYLKILREDKDKGKKTSFIVRLVRSKVELKEEGANVYYKNIKGREIGIIKIPSFYGSGRFGQKSVSRDVRELLLKPRIKNTAALVVDLSNNRGGSLDEAITLSGFFFSKGNVVKQSERLSRAPHVFSDKDALTLYKKPLVVLVNRLSASASEIVSGTLQNYKRAIIVGGDHTFGKGSVQSVEHLPFKLGAIKTTVGLYFIPDGRSTQNQGVVSDISLPSVFNLDDLGEKSLDYALPQKKIKSFLSPGKDIFSKDSGTNWKPVQKNTIKKLASLSSKRVSQSKKFKKIHKKLLKYRKQAKNKKPISVIEILSEKRTGEELKKEKEKLLNLNEKEKAEEYLVRPDLEEAIYIAYDLARLQTDKSVKD